ncbi:MAG: hypothetical protein Q8J85_07880 [Sulfuricurvum sp.]|nr:hypothetical protein [Sulfuricurvum sp.]MDP3023157.1 hypothetical protein [Sulfuricurvum sp.]
MKMTNYRLQTEMEHIKPENQDFFKNYVRQVLESNKPYHAKADYLGLSIQEIDNKISYLADDIKEMSALKKSLMEAKTVALEAIASVLSEYGIDRLDGTVISSITITPKKIKLTETFKIIDEQALIQLGYYSVVVDEQAVREAMSTLEGMNEVDEYVEVGVTTETIPARLRVNTRHTSNNTQASELLTLVENQEAA